MIGKKSLNTDDVLWVKIDDVEYIPFSTSISDYVIFARTYFILDFFLGLRSMIQRMVCKRGQIYVI